MKPYDQNSKPYFLEGYGECGTIHEGMSAIDLWYSRELITYDEWVTLGDSLLDQYNVLNARYIPSE